MTDRWRAPKRDASSCGSSTPSTSPPRLAAKFGFSKAVRRPLGAALSGVLLSLAFPTAGAWYLIFVGLVPLLLVLHEGSRGPREAAPSPRGARWAPWLSGVVFNVLMFWWIVRIPASAMTQPWLIFPALVALGLYLGLYVALFGWLTRLVRRRLGWPVLWIAPVAWTAAEWAKSSGPLGCPWGNLGYALASKPAWIQMASLTGAPGLTFWVVLVNALVAGAIVARRWPTRVVCVLVAVAAVALPVRWGHERLRAEAPGPLARIVIVQPNIGSEEKWNPALQDSVVEVLYRSTRAAATLTPRPDLILWPETSLPFYVRLEPLKLARLRETVREAGIPVLAGYPDARLSSGGTTLIHNAAGLIRPNGAFAAQYEKIHLVPFGERIPFQDLFPFLGKIDLGQAEWTPGSRPVVFTGAGAAFGVLICFESIFPDLARQVALEGAQYLVNITNDEWFGKTAGPVQHADMAILRSVELGRSTARCANTGISMIVDPYGRVLARTPLFERTLIVGDVPNGLDTPTLFLRWGDWVTLICLALSGILLVLAWFRPIQRLDRAAESSGWR